MNFIDDIEEIFFKIFETLQNLIKYKEPVTEV